MPFGSHQVDLQLESGEYFLKSHEKEARESERKKQKVRSRLLLFSTRCSFMYFSKQKPQPRDVQNVQKHMLPLSRPLPPPSKKNDTRNERSKSWVQKNLEGLRNRRRKRDRRRSLLPNCDRSWLDFNVSQYGNWQITLITIEFNPQRLLTSIYRYPECKASRHFVKG